MKTRISIAVGFVAILALPFAYGQLQSPVSWSVTTPFKFMVDKKEMPAGKYEVVREEGLPPHLLLRNVQTKASIFVPIMERLAELNPTQKHTAKAVFDVVGDQRYLSEFWPPDNHDGYLLGINKGEQKHEVVEQK